MIDRDEADRAAQLKDDRCAETDAPSGKDAPPPEYRAPRHLTLNAEIKVPSPNLYQSDIPQLLRRFLYSSDLFDESTVADLAIAGPDPAKVLSPLVYQVNYWLSKETMARVQKQLTMFRET